MADSDLKKRGGGGRGGGGHPEIRGGPVSKNVFFGPSGLSLVLNKGGPGASLPLLWIRHWSNAILKVDSTTGFL